jgi:hypothetical protein
MESPRLQAKMLDRLLSEKGFRIQGFRMTLIQVQDIGNTFLRKWHQKVVEFGDAVEGSGPYEYPESICSGIVQGTNKFQRFMLQLRNQYRNRL